MYAWTTRAIATPMEAEAEAKEIRVDFRYEPIYAPWTLEMQAFLGQGKYVTWHLSVERMLAAISGLPEDRWMSVHTLALIVDGTKRVPPLIILRSSTPGEPYTASTLRFYEHQMHVFLQMRATIGRVFPTDDSLDEAMEFYLQNLLSRED